MMILLGRRSLPRAVPADAAFDTDAKGTTCTDA
jgi:hypothetical protein